MIEGKQVYWVVEGVVPLYVGMLVGYGSVRWWGIFTPVQCSGINRFVAMFAVPVLSLNIIATSNMYHINYIFIAADTLHKLALLLFLILAGGVSLPLEWLITLFSVSSLPNTLIMGIPLVNAMYGEVEAKLMIQIIVFQSLLWYNVLLILFEYRAANNLLSQHFPNHRIASVKLDDDVISLSGALPLHLQADSSSSSSDPNDGISSSRLHVRVMNKPPSHSDILLSLSTTSSSSNFRRRPTLSDMSGVEIYSVHSSPPSSTNHNNNNMIQQHYYYDGSRSSAGASSSNSTAAAAVMMIMPPPPTDRRRSRSSQGRLIKEDSSFVYDDDIYGVSSLPTNTSIRRVRSTEIISQPSIASENNGGSARKSSSVNNNITRGGGGEEEEYINNNNSSSIRPATPAAASVAASVVTKLILTLVWRKLSRNPNTYASILGVVWSLVANRWGLKIPKIVQGCITIIANTGLGMAVFSLGLFMGLQPKIISCGKKAAAISMGMKFIVGPAVMAVTSLALGIRGTLLRVAILQAALPVGIVPFVFAKEYDVHADILSTSVIFGMLLALPIAILYNVLLAL